MQTPARSDEPTPYRWALAGVIAVPYVIRKAALLLDSVERTTRAPLGHPPFRWFGERVPFRNGLTLCRARVRSFYLPHEQHRGSVGVALFDGDALVGSSTRPHLFLEPGYRGFGLGAELIAERLLAHPDLWLTPERATPRIHLTGVGERAMDAAHTLLLDRGAIVLV